MQVEQEIRDPLLLSGHPSAKDTYQALEEVLKDQLACSRCIDEARGMLQAMIHHRKRLGELQQQYGRIVPEADASDAPLVAEREDAQSAIALEHLSSDVVCELMKRETDLLRAEVHLYEGLTKQAEMDIWRLRRSVSWVNFEWLKEWFYRKCRSW